LRKERHSLNVKVTPNAPRNQLLGWTGDILRARISAPPGDHPLNQKLERFLAAYLEIPQTDVEVVSGFGKQTKTVEIAGVEPERIAQRLKKPVFANA
jgi:uncharacterized protein YggU (UPF0235/DUF167 family)